MSSIREVVYHGKDNKASKDRACPVHVDRCRVRYRREKDQNSSERKVAKGCEVDRKTPFAQAESRREKCFSSHALSHHAADNDDVGDGKTNTS